MLFYCDTFIKKASSILRYGFIMRTLKKDMSAILKKISESIPVLPVDDHSFNEVEDLVLDPGPVTDECMALLSGTALSRYKALRAHPFFLLSPEESDSSSYQLDRHLDSGGFSHVFSAFQLQYATRRVALKVLKPERFSEECIESFWAEGKLLQKLNAENILKCTDLGVIEWLGAQYPFLALEYACSAFDSKYFKEYVDNLPPDEMMAFLSAAMIPSAKGLQEFHDESPRSIHYDIKPGNLLLMPDGTVKLADFGYASSSLGSTANDEDAIGTLDYMAPENFFYGEKPNALVDIFSFGVMWYEIITGERPFQDHLDRIADVFNHLPVHIQYLRIMDMYRQDQVFRVLQIATWKEKLREKGLRPGVIEWLIRCLSYDPNERVLKDQTFFESLCSAFASDNQGSLLGVY